MFCLIKYTLQEPVLGTSARWMYGYIEELRERLVAVVQETMQPAFVTLWLRQTERQEKALDDGLKDH